MFRSFAAILLAVSCLLIAGEASARPSPVKWSAQVEPMTARVGEVVTLTVTADVPKPYHIYSAVRPKAPADTITPQPTEVSVDLKNLKPLDAIRETPPHTVIDPNFDNLTLGLHEGKPQFTRQYRIESGTPGGLALGVSVTFMACTDKQCLPPDTAKLDALPLTLEAGEPRAEYANPSTSASGNSAIFDASGAADGDLLPFLATAFGAGLLALVTPCVFPMIPVTFAYFTKQATGNQRGILKLAATYCVAIIVAFTGIGAVLAATIGASGANQVAANPYVNLVFAGLFVLFGVALLEVVELRLPSGLQSLSSKGNEVGGTLGVGFMGLTFVIAAFTCTAPFIGTVLVAASQAQSGAQWVRPILGMTAFATALALPFFLLALFPGLLARLPKSGAWLSTVKGTMGFIEIAAALKFLSNADLVWQWQILTQPVLLALWTLIAAAGGLWLLGALRIGWGTPDGPPTLARKVWAGVFFAAGLYFLYGMTGRPLQADLEAFLPPSEYRYTGASQTAAPLAENELPFLDSLEAGMAQAKKDNKPIFIDFTGYTCTNCRKMEKTVFPVPGVRQELEKFVRVRLYTDGGVDGPKNQSYQEETFGDVALPLYAVLTPEGKPVAKSAGLSAPDDFARFLREGQQRQVAVVSGR